MAKVFLREVASHMPLYRDSITGIAWIEDGNTGCGISIHPNIDASGSVRGMKQQGYWGKKDRTVKSHGFIYNIDHIVFDYSEDSQRRALENIVAIECRCPACIERREEK